MNPRIAAIVVGACLLAAGVAFVALRQPVEKPAPPPPPPPPVKPPEKPATPPPPESATAKALRCTEFPPICGAGPCPPFSRSALAAALDLRAEERAARLRAWLCASPGPSNPDETLREVAEVLRESQSRHWCREVEEGEPPHAQRMTGDISPALARRLLCQLPWSALLGKPWLLERIGCPECACIDESGGDAPECTGCGPCGDQTVSVPGVCMLGYAQNQEEFQTEVSAEVRKCAEEAAAANAPAAAATAGREQEHARRVVTKLRASLPLDAGKWRELVAASILLDYGAEPRRGPFSVVPAGAPSPDEQAMRDRVRPLMAAAKTPPGLDASGVVESKLTMLSGADGTAVVVCDAAPDNTVGRKAVLWVQKDRVVPIDGPRVEQGQVVGDYILTPCPFPTDLADLDGDGKPELLLHRITFTSASEIEVFTLTDPPVKRGSAPPSPR